jgi:hypothetical protein
LIPAGPADRKRPAASKRQTPSSRKTRIAIDFNQRRQGKFDFFCLFLFTSWCWLV